MPFFQKYDQKISDLEIAHEDKKMKVVNLNYFFYLCDQKSDAHLLVFLETWAECFGVDGIVIFINEI